MNVRALKLESTSNDWAMLCSWWTGWGHPILPLDLIPKSAFMVYEGPKNLAVAFLVLTDAAYAFATTVVSNPESTWQERETAIPFLLNRMGRVAKDFGHRELIILPAKPRLRDKIKLAGFEIYPEQVFLCMKEL